MLAVRLPDERSLYEPRLLSADFFLTVSRILIKAATDFGDCLRALKTKIGFLLGQKVVMKGINKLELQASKDI